MKTIKFLLGILFVSSMAIGFTACSSDDDKEVFDPNNPNEYLDDHVNSSWKEEGNKVIYTTTYDYGYGISYTAKWTLTFENDLCVKSICECSFSSGEIAQAFYEGYKDVYPVSISGKKVTVDFTSDHKGLSKAELKAALEIMAGYM